MLCSPVGIFEDITMNYPAPTHLIVTRDYGETNRKLLAKEAAADLTRVESASRKVNISLASPEGTIRHLIGFRSRFQVFQFRIGQHGHLPLLHKSVLAADSFQTINHLARKK